MTILFQDVEYNEEDFLQTYIEQKRKENDAKEFRIEMEKALLEKYGDNVEENKLSKQFKVGRYLVRIKRNISYKLTDAGWEMVWKMPEVERPIKFEYSHTKGKNYPFLLLEEIENETKPSFEVIYK
jgi:hypothetical protein